MSRTHIRPGERVALGLSPIEREQLLASLVYLPPELAHELRLTPQDQDLRLTLDDLDDLAGCVASAANHAKDRQDRKNLERIFSRIDNLLEQYTDQEAPELHGLGQGHAAAAIAQQAAELAEWAAKILVGCRGLTGTHGRRVALAGVEGLRLSPEERARLASIPSVGTELAARLRSPRKRLSIEETCHLCLTLAEALPGAESMDQVRLLLVADRVTAALQRSVSQHPERPSAQPSRRRNTTLYQFKIALQDITPPIWRRVQTKDCTLQELHRRIQAAMGWEGYHLYDFEIYGRRYVVPDPEGDFAEFEQDTLDPRDYMLNEVLPADGKRMTFRYRYDFGDGWEHQVVFEGCPKAAKGQRYPHCVEGARACPPEDVGGIVGYLDYLDAIRDPDHPEHKAFLEWGGVFDPEAFEVAAANRRLQQRR